MRIIRTATVEGSRLLLHKLRDQPIGCGAACNGRSCWRPATAKRQTQTSSMRSFPSRLICTIPVVSFVDYSGEFISRSTSSVPVPIRLTKATTSLAIWLTIEVTLNPLSPPLDDPSHHGLRNPSTEVLSDYKQQVHLRPNSKSFSTDSEFCCLRHFVNRGRFQNQKACANTFLIAAPSTHCYRPHRNGHHWQAGSQVQ
jgi:hypothetical protein